MSNNLSLWDLYNKQNEFLSLLNTHNHDASNLTGLSNVATSGNFNDLKNIPSIVNTVNGKKGTITLTSDDVNAVSKNASCNKNWNYTEKTGQPSYVWGGNNNLDMYIYNPSNFSVSNARNADYAISAGMAGSANTAKVADVATKLADSKTVELTGAVVGSASFDGSSNLSINTALSNGYDMYMFSDTLRHTLANGQTTYRGSGSYKLGNFIAKKDGIIKVKTTIIANPNGEEGADRNRGESHTMVGLLNDITLYSHYTGTSVSYSIDTYTRILSIDSSQDTISGEHIIKVKKGDILEFIHTADKTNNYGICVAVNLAIYYDEI